MFTGKQSVWIRTLEIIVIAIALVAAGYLILVGTESYWKKPAIAAKMGDESAIKAGDMVVLSFNQPVSPEKVAQKLNIEPQTDILLAWHKNNTELDIKPANFFQPGQEYTLHLPVENGILGYQKGNLVYKFKVQDYPKVQEILPGKDDKDVSITSDFKVTFDRSIRDYNINFSVNPENGFRWEGDDDKKGFRIFSGEKLQYSTNYVMKITAQPLSNGAPAAEKEIFSASFPTEPEPVAIVVPDPAPGSVVSIPPDQQIVAKISDGKYIDINLKQQTLSIFQDGKDLGDFRVSSGKRGMETPTGTFSVMAKRGRAWSKKYGLFMPYFMQFTNQGHGIHELPEWPGGYKEGANHLGTPVSHGCVRLGVGPAAKVYAWADVGTPIVIHY